MKPKLNFSLPSLVKWPGMKKQSDYIILDVAGAYVKVLHARNTSGRLQIENAAREKFAETEIDEAAKFIADSLRQFGVRLSQASCVLSSKYFMSRNIDMPSNNLEEIAKIINLQIGRFTPYSRDEIVVDYLCREMVGMHYTNVLLTIVHRKVVERCYQIAEKAGLSLERIVIAPEALAHVCAGFPETKDVKTFAVVHIGEAASDLLISEDQRMVFVRSISIGNSHLKKDPVESKASFVSELNRSIAAYQDEGIGEPVKKLLISGMIQELDSLTNSIREAIPNLSETKEGIKAVDYTERFSLSPTASVILKDSSEISFFELAATAVYGAQAQLDMVPKELKLKRHVREGSKDILTLGILIMSFFLLISLLLTAKIYFKKVESAKLDEINESTFDKARTLERISTKSRAIRQLLENRSRGLHVFDKISSLIGDDLYVTLFSYDVSGQLQIGGTAESMSRIFAFVTQLEESNYFLNVKTKETKSRREGKKEVADFVIEGQLAEGF